MDNSQLIALVIATVIVSIVKEFVVWATRRTTSAGKTLIGKLIIRVIPIFRNRHHVFIGVDIVMMIVSAVFVVYLLFSKYSLNKLMVVLISVNCAAWFYWQRQLERDVETYDTWKRNAA